MVAQSKGIGLDEVSCESSSCSHDDNLGDDEAGFASSRNDSENCGHSTSSGSMGKEVSEVEAIAREDTKMLQAWRRIVTVIILCTFGVVLGGAITFLKKNEDKETYNNYLLFATAAKEAVIRKSKEYVLAMDNMAETITVSASEEHQFPFVSMLDYEIFASQARSLTSNDIISWAPLVKEDQRKEWSDFSETGKGWYNESTSIYMIKSGESGDIFHPDDDFRSYIWNEYPELDASPPSTVHAPLWESSPPPLSISTCNYDLLQDTEINSTFSDLLQYRDAIVGEVKLGLNALSKQFIDPNNRNDTGLINYIYKYDDAGYKNPHSIHMQPVFATLNDRESDIVGFLLSMITWEYFLVDLIHEDVAGILAVLENTCDQAFTYELHGQLTYYIGEGDLHDPSYDGTKVLIPLNFYRNTETAFEGRHCAYSLALYKTKDFMVGESSTSTIVIVAVAAAAAFMVMGLTFFMYDRFVRRRNDKIVYAAARSNAIISSMFPTQVRDRLFAERDEKNANKDYKGHKANFHSVLSSNIKELNENGKESIYKDRPLADLFPETTILFADIVGFTAWSSVREPSQVFVLLETIFQTFDDIARKRRVYKVETVGDCYVAVVGLPEPRPDHAMVMARFARDCMVKMQSLVKKLELTLGPDTGELSMRMGIHSGPVTAGVLRGERSRFQLFGDTMNTAARMEHTGRRGQIQVSEDTATLLMKAGKTSWVTERDDVVDVKGKGEMKTYWLNVVSHRGNSNSVSEGTTSNGSLNVDDFEEVDNHNVKTENSLDDKTARLVQWNVDVLLRSLKQIVARRQMNPIVSKQNSTPDEKRFTKSGTTFCLDEVIEIITLPGFQEVEQEDETDDVSIPVSVKNQLVCYLSHIAKLYNNNPFHNFEHASHVTMSVGKLLSRIVAPQNFNDTEDRGSTLHDHTYGITSDPLTQFSCILSALIHDVGHPGVPNAQLILENCPLATSYNNKSPAEQNSVDLAWNLLMEDRFKDLRAAIYETDAELIRFRQLIVNSVMATDISDRELKVLRNLRWDRAFSSKIADEHERDSINRKATIVIEHLIQASDVAHTMQHWHIYRKWNERFFRECYKAYIDGRSDKNPADGWYEGEIGFFDYYIIPLAKKLKECGVFGVSSDEYLNYAMNNRQEWEARGKELVNEMLESVEHEKFERLGKEIVVVVTREDPPTVNVGMENTYVESCETKMVDTKHLIMDLLSPNNEQSMHDKDANQMKRKINVFGGSEISKSPPRAA